MINPKHSYTRTVLNDFIPPDYQYLQRRSLGEKTICGITVLIASAVDTLKHSVFCILKIATGILATPIYALTGSESLANWTWKAASKHLFQAIKHLGLFFVAPGHTFFFMPSSTLKRFFKIDDSNAQKKKITLQEEQIRELSRKNEFLLKKCHKIKTKLNEDVKKQRKKYVAVQEDLDKANADIASKTEALKQAQRTLSNLKNTTSAQSKKIEELSTQVFFLKQDLRDTCDRLSTQAHTIHQEKDKSETEATKFLNRQVHQLTTENEKQTKTINDLVKNLNKSLQKNTDLQQQNISLQQQNTGLQKQNTDLQQHITSLQKQNTSLQKQNTGLQKQYDEVTTAVADMSQELLCPITCEILTDPVKLGCGHNFEKSAIEGHIQNKKKNNMEANCPLCQNKIEQIKIESNSALRDLAAKMKVLIEVFTKHGKPLNI